MPDRASVHGTDVKRGRGQALPGGQTARAHLLVLTKERYGDVHEGPELLRKTYVLRRRRAAAGRTDRCVRALPRVGVQRLVKQVERRRVGPRRVAVRRGSSGGSDGGAAVPATVLLWRCRERAAVVAAAGATAHRAVMVGSPARRGRPTGLSCACLMLDDDHSDRGTAV